MSFSSSLVEEAPLWSEMRMNSVNVNVKSHNEQKEMMGTSTFSFPSQSQPTASTFNYRPRLTHPLLLPPFSIFLCPCLLITSLKPLPILTLDLNNPNILAVSNVNVTFSSATTLTRIRLRTSD